MDVRRPVGGLRRQFSRTGSDVYVVGAEGGTPRRLTSGKGHELRPSLSADGQWLYYSSENQVWKVAIKGGAPVKVTSGGTKPRESLDGRWLYYSKDNAVWRLATTGGAEELFLPDLTENNWTLSAEAMLSVIEIDAAQSAVLVSFDLQTRQKASAPSICTGYALLQCRLARCHGGWAIRTYFSPHAG